jgi:hypothetical protein
MYYRVTKVKHQVGARNQMVGVLDSKKDLMKSIEGLQSVRLIEIDETISMGISLYENEQQVVDAEEKFKEIMGGMMPYMTGPPEIINGEQFWEFKLE